MGLVSGITRRGAVWRRRHGRVVLWGGRRYDIQVGSERDLRRTQLLDAFRYRYRTIFTKGALEALTQSHGGWTR